MKSLVSSLFAVLFTLSAAAFAVDPTSTDISSPWWDSEHVPLNPAADDNTTPPAPPVPDTDKEKS